MRLVTRLRADGALSLQAVKTALATSLAYEAGRLTSSPYPVFAALAALLVVQVTVFDSVSRGLQRVGGVVAGVLVSFGVARLVGLHAWSLGLVVLLALVLGKTLHLGDAGAVQVPVSALLVLTVGTSGRYVEDRILETVLGAAVGILVNVAVVPPTRTRDAGTLVADLASALGHVLDNAGNGLQSEEWAASAPGWLESARRVRTTVERARAAVDRAETSLKLNPRGTRLVPAARRRRVALRALEHVNVQVRGITRTLLDAAELVRPDPDAPEGSDARETRNAALEQMTARAPARRAAGQSLVAVAAVLQAYAAVALEPAAHDSSAEVRELRSALAAARERVAAAAQTARAMPTWSESGWLIYGSLLTDVDRVLDELDGKAQAELLAERLLPRTGVRVRARREQRSD